ncbi:MAG TPA: urea ABC transporter ATP-binding subunit UrtE [Polyangiaceae bacterium]|jgi:urea transport system ATP-binding protein|nr:urea ABC transporter ATP-binding subunit UrtE [Polyangiaceae bacterium]
MSAEPLQVDSIRVCYGESEAIGNLSFRVQQGEILAVMGLNGMGKTTLMKALIGLLSVRAGSIKVTGRDVTRAKPFERVGAGLAYVPQGRLLFPTLTVDENIQTGLPRSNREVPAQLYEFFPAIGKMRNRRAGNLSGGQQQQVAIARALASNPRVLLLDEPTEGLQPSIIKELAVELRRIRDERGVTVVVSEQVLSFALAAADRVLVMARGAIIHEGARGELDETELGQLLAL